MQEKIERKNADQKKLYIKPEVIALVGSATSSGTFFSSIENKITTFQTLNGGPGS